MFLLGALRIGFLRERAEDYETSAFERHRTSKIFNFASTTASLRSMLNNRMMTGASNVAFAPINMAKSPNVTTAPQFVPIAPERRGIPSTPTTRHP
jgi:hypothetical protein